jgi:hypothetical protein
MKKHNRAGTKGALIGAGLALLSTTGFASPAKAETLAPTKAIEGKDLHVTEMRNMSFCEIEVVAGFPPLVNLRFRRREGDLDGIGSPPRFSQGGGRRVRAVHNQPRLKISL